MHGLLASQSCYHSVLPLVCVHCGPVEDFFITKQTSLHPFDFVRNLFHLLFIISWWSLYDYHQSRAIHLIRSTWLYSSMLSAMFVLSDLYELLHHNQSRQVPAAFKSYMLVLSCMWWVITMWEQANFMRRNTRWAKRLSWFCAIVGLFPRTEICLGEDPDNSSCTFIDVLNNTDSNRNNDKSTCVEWTVMVELAQHAEIKEFKR